MGNVPQVSLFRNPILYFRSRIIEKQVKELQKYSISQEEYFAGQLKWLYRVEDKLLFEGYDAPFMERDSTLEALREITKPSNGVYVSAILPEGLDTVLDELAEKSPFVTLIRTPEKLVEGYTIFDNWRLSLWDSTESTYYPPEEEKGVFYRASACNYRQIWEYTNMFRESERELRG